MTRMTKTVVRGKKNRAHQKMRMEKLRRQKRKLKRQRRKVLQKQSQALEKKSLRTSLTKNEEIVKEEKILPAFKTQDIYLYFG